MIPVMLDAGLTPQMASLYERVGLGAFVLVAGTLLIVKYGKDMIQAYKDRTDAMRATCAIQEAATDAMDAHSVALSTFTTDIKAHIAKDDELMQVFRDAMARVETLASKANDSNGETQRMIAKLGTDLEAIKWHLRKYGLIIPEDKKDEKKGEFA